MRVFFAAKNDVGQMRVGLISAHASITNIPIKSQRQEELHKVSMEMRREMKRDYKRSGEDVSADRLKK